MLRVAKNVGNRPNSLQIPYSREFGIGDRFRRTASATSLRSLRELRLGKPSSIYRSEASEGRRAEAFGEGGPVPASYGWASHSCHLQPKAIVRVAAA
jgi:hypothetical protein